MENATSSKQEPDNKAQEIKEETPTEEIKYFECENCKLKEKYEYFGKEPPMSKKYKYLEDVYLIEDPFQPPKQGEVLILGTHCIRCNKSVCKDTQCSFYFDGTFCIQCAKNEEKNFPNSVQEKINRIIITEKK